MRSRSCFKRHSVGALFNLVFIWHQTMSAQSVDVLFLEDWNWGCVFSFTWVGIY